MFEFKRGKFKLIKDRLGIKDILSDIQIKYQSGMSSAEIKEVYINAMGGDFYISVKAIDEIVRALGITRNSKERFRLAIDKGRMIYKTKDKPYSRKGISTKQRYSILEADGFKCRACGSKEFLEIDHIIPIGKGGTNDPTNLQTLCRECNAGKCYNEHDRYKNME
jgi:hypothetical protein